MTNVEAFSYFKARLPVWGVTIENSYGNRVCVWIDADFDGANDRGKALAIVGSKQPGLVRIADEQALEVAVTEASTYQG